MRVHTLRRDQVVPYSREEVFSFFQSPENLALITPPWLGFQILTPLPIAMKVGTLIDYTIRWQGITIRWRTLITTYEPPNLFVDEQMNGPYSFWHHIHRFEDAPGGTKMTDVVRYALPFGAVGEWMHGLIIRRHLETIFDFRASTVQRMLGARPVSARPPAHSQRLTTQEMLP